MIDGTGNASEVHSQIEKISDFFVELNKPKNFRPKDSTNDIVKLEYNYENLCALLEANGTQRAKSLTIFEFYARLDYLKKASSPKNKNP